MCSGRKATPQPSIFPDVLKEAVGWNINTTYTLIKRCIKKGAIERREPHFMCHALIPKEQVQAQETDELINKFSTAPPTKLFASLLSRKSSHPSRSPSSKPSSMTMRKNDHAKKGSPAV